MCYIFNMPRKTIINLSLFIIVVLIFALGINVTPVHKAGAMDRVFEKINLFLHFSPASKAEYWQKLVDVRLTNLKSIVEQNNLDLIEETSSRYSTYVGRYSDYIINNQIRSQKEIAIGMFNKHLETLPSLQAKYKYDSAWWLLIQHDINTLNIFKEKIDKEL